MAYVADSPLLEAEGNRSFEVNQVLATRGASGWSSQDIVTPNEQGRGLAVGFAPEYQFFSGDLALSLVAPAQGGKNSGKLAEPPLSPPLSEAEAGHQEKTIYLRDDSPVAPGSSEAASYAEAHENGVLLGNPGYVALVSEANVLPGAQFGPNASGELLHFAGATSDLGHVIIRADTALTAERTAPGENLYEWANGKPQEQLRLVSVLPGGAGEPASGSAVGRGECRCAGSDLR